MTDKAESKKPLSLFLSYSRDDEAKARRLASCLQSLGYTVWWDALIEGGATYAERISKALDEADVVIVLWSEHSVASDWVRDEAAQGRDRHRLVPLSLDGTLPPLGFRQYQVIDLSHWQGRKGAKEIAALERAIAATANEDATARHGRVRTVSRRPFLLGGTAAAVVIVAGGTWFAADRGWFSSGSGGVLSLAVIPFRNLSGNASEAYFSDGLTDEVRAALARIPQLHVLAATSSAKASEKDADPKSVAAALGVSYVLNGSVQRAGDVVRIVAELIDGRTGFSKWSASQDYKLTDIFAVQSQIAGMVAQAMSVQVATIAPAPGGTRIVPAYEAYLRGRALFNLAKDEASDRAALADYEQALALDPDFALAHAARSRSLVSWAAEYAKADQIRSLYDQAIAAARRAVALAPNLAEAQLALGFALYTCRLDVAGARPYYQRAYALGGGNADIALLYALYCSRAGWMQDAMAAVDRAVALDPLNARAFRAKGSVTYAARRYAEALPPLAHALQLNPKMTYAHALGGYAFLGLNRLEDALREFELEPQAQFHFSGLAIGNARLGRQEAAQKAFSDLVAEVGDSAVYQQAEVMAQWGRTDDALRKLERARQVGDSGLIYVMTDPLLDPVRGDPRFKRFVTSLRSAGSSG
jgi:TolB-like protein/Tfp pilus assembly protein PilF